MDTTDIYIKMCREATEIQEYRENNMSSEITLFSIWFNSKNKEINCDKGGLLSEFNKVDDRVIWLPRQDQLQDMLEGDLIDKLHKFNKVFVDRIIVATPNISKRDLAEFRQQWEKYIESGNKACIIASEEIKIELTIIYPQLQSMEQMWLAFVMKENHNKIWNFENKKWEKIK